MFFALEFNYNTDTWHAEEAKCWEFLFPYPDLNDLKDRFVYVGF